ncbi:MAG TPA: polyphosphate kinase 2 family protein [Pirellulales bacterium]|jgi:PPK2 family polyphosphate:nucleotide phosphotransferase|nr:polyphosphate kinase 2 family protein [Pirellulales bacterium]
MLKPELMQQLRIAPGKRFRLKDHDPGWHQTRTLKKLGKKISKAEAQTILADDLAQLATAQALLWASDATSVLIVLQGMDACGKDGTIKHVMSGLNPQGCEVHAFKKPTEEELSHNFLWRYAQQVPERGRIGIFNRSYYEDVLVVRVHPELLACGRSSGPKPTGSFWRDRYQDINNFERHLARNGTVILKFFLHISKGEQRRRLLDRLDDPRKHWKFSAADVAERAYWPDYAKAYEAALTATSTRWAPWYVIPADAKWSGRALVADIVTRTIESLGLKYPQPNQDERKALEKARKKLKAE